MIRSFRQRSLEKFFRTGSKAGIDPRHGARLGMQLGMLEAAVSPADMNLPGWRMHPLRGSLNGTWAVWVDKNWRLTFAFDGTDATNVDYLDYH